MDSVTNNTWLGALAVQGIDFCIDENGENHHTSKFNLMTRPVDRYLVVRRGQAFNLDLLLNRPYNVTKDAVSFTFYVAEHSTMAAAVPLLQKRSMMEGGWSAIYEGQVDSRLTVAITSAADCNVAPWRLDIRTELAGGGSAKYTHPKPIYVLFNPWCPYDTVYMPESTHRVEYVQEEYGCIYVIMGYIEWKYDQYEENILEWSMHLVKEIGKVKGSERGDPILVTRALTAALNMEEDNGVLFGKWPKNTSEYSDGKKPASWTRSLDILKKYFEEKKPVKYAQCFVFAGVMTTVCRALGIPCRPVTGYNAGDDTDRSLTIDVILNEDGAVCESEKIWNFHVWNEVWMERRDLGSEFGGWQAIDATPHEESSLFRCGPASLNAVREGNLHLPYDAGYIFAQANADLLTWQDDGANQPMKLIEVNTTEIGQNLSTKAVGVKKREIITHLYKYREASRDDFRIKEKVLQLSSNWRAQIDLKQADDVIFKFEFREDFKLGQDFTLVLQMENRSKTSEYHVKGTLGVNQVLTNGLRGESVKRSEFNLALAPATKHDVDMLVTFNEYYTRLDKQKKLFFNIKATIIEKEYDYIVTHKFVVRCPDLRIKVDGKLVSNQDVTIRVALENPLPFPLNSMFFLRVGLEKEPKIKEVQDVAPGETASANFEMTLPDAGSHFILARFDSEELTSRKLLPIDVGGRDD